MFSSYEQLKRVLKKQDFGLHVVFHIWKGNNSKITKKPGQLF